MSRMRVCISGTLLFTLLTAFPGVASGDEAADQAAKLAGTRAKEWVFTKWETFLGPGNRCKAGQVHTETQPWAIQSADQLETHVKVGNTSYILKFWDGSKRHL